jgi:hypothetical protein
MWQLKSLSNASIGPSQSGIQDEQQQGLYTQIWFKCCYVQTATSFINIVYKLKECLVIPQKIKKSYYNSILVWKKKYLSGKRKTRIHEKQRVILNFRCSIHYSLFLITASWIWILHHKLLWSYTDFLFVSKVRYDISDKLPSLLYARIPKSLPYHFCQLYMPWTLRLVIILNRLAFHNNKPHVQEQAICHLPLLVQHLMLLDQNLCIEDLVPGVRHSGKALVAAVLV